MKDGESILFLPGQIGERALRARLAAGEEGAYRECYQHYGPRLLRTLVRILRNRASAEEILQETFAAAFNSVGQFRGEVTLLAWLTRIATNRAYNAIRDQGRRTKNTVVVGDETVQPLVESRDLARRVLAILDDIDSPKRLALLLQLEGYSVNEIAEILAVPRGTVLSRLSRARSELALRVTAAGLISERTKVRVEDGP
ncbi:MAG TPA: RNA polymerase sigma factor [Polyangia bacterium]